VFSSDPAHRGAALRKAFRKWGLATAAGLVVGIASLGAQARTAESNPGQDPTSSTIALAALPVQAQETHRLVRQGGPFPYRKDGSVFFNRERLLPPKARGYYREYTVPTPGSRDRGARRLVCGGEQPVEPDACYYTADHYASFRRIAQ
jgi:ribonuclease T1